ncbi:hypothetical protein TNCV_3607171 [Trichonephila clavipes]|nr:hypothetical protein TNCV_3607171 [Trichonephila clavipes]
MFYQQQPTSSHGGCAAEEQVFTAEKYCRRSQFSNHDLYLSTSKTKVDFENLSYSAAYLAQVSLPDLATVLRHHLTSENLKIKSQLIFNLVLL